MNDMMKKKYLRFTKIKPNIKVGTAENIASLWVSAHKTPHPLFFLTAPTLILIIIILK